MRVDVRKFLFVGLKEAKDAFFQQAQEKGIVHFIQSGSSASKELPAAIQRTIFAIKILRGCPTVEQEELHNYSLTDEVCDSILQLNDRLNQLSEQQRITELEIARVEIFGDFSVEDIDYIEREGHKKIQFFCAKKGVAESLEFPNEALFIGSGHDLDYFMTVNDQTRHYDKLVEMKIEEPVSQLRKKLAHLKTEIHQIDRSLKQYARYNDYLHHALMDKLNSYHLHAAQKLPEYEMDGSLFVVQGWVPQNRVNELKAIVKGKEVYFDEIAIEVGDKVPTCLQNEGAARWGEDLVRIYDIPSNTDKDPSLWVLGFFSLFFAFIMGDGGYGLILLATALYLRFKFTTVKKTGRRFLNLFTLLACSCVAWGLLTNSFFGISFPLDSPLQKFSLVKWLVAEKVDYHNRMQDQTFKEWEKLYPQIAGLHSPAKILEAAATEQNGEKKFEMFSTFSNGIMLELALLIGVIHISLSFARNLRKNWSGIGWIFFMIGGYCYVPYYLGTASLLHTVFGLDEATLGPQGLYVLLGGFSAAIILSVCQSGLWGLLAITTVIQVFADVLSYLRLYALGLAGGIVSSTVNELAEGLIFVAAVLVILAGHTINIALSVMGGVIHGLRLNFLEWYHYCFEGDGQNFTPLQKIEIDH